MIREHALTSPDADWRPPPADECWILEQRRNKLKRRTTFHVSPTCLSCQRQRRCKPFPNPTEALATRRRSAELYAWELMDTQTVVFHQQFCRAQHECSIGRPKAVSTLTNVCFCWCELRAGCKRVAFCARRTGNWLNVFNRKTTRRADKNG